MRALSEYEWRSPEARQTYEEIQHLLRREVLDSQFKGMKNALENASPEDMQRVKDMMADLNSMLEADSRGEDTDQMFKDFMEKHGDFFPGSAGKPGRTDRRARPSCCRSGQADAQPLARAAPGAVGFDVDGYGRSRAAGRNVAAAISPPKCSPRSGLGSGTARAR